MVHIATGVRVPQPQIPSVRSIRVGRTSQKWIGLERCTNPFIRHTGNGRGGYASGGYGCVVLLTNVGAGLNPVHDHRGVSSL